MKVDRGFAPNIDYDICSLTGCKDLIEKHAQKGSWVIGIGGNGTKKPNKLIYAMEVEENQTIKKFKQKYPKKSKYLKGEIPGSNVLISKKFYYLGKRAIDLPKNLKGIIKYEWGCKCIKTNDIVKLIKYLSNLDFRKYGVYGKPNNLETSKECK